MHYLWNKYVGELVKTDFKPTYIKIVSFAIEKELFFFKLKQNRIEV